MNRIFLSLIFILIALITLSSACAASDLDNNIDVIDQDDIADDISIDESVEPLDDDVAENDEIPENYTEESDEIPINETVIDESDVNNAIVTDKELNEEYNGESREIYSIESVSSDYSDSWIDELINNMADEMVENLTRDAFIPDVDVKPINASIEILGPTFNAAMYYYAYWQAYKNYFGIFGFANAVTAIYALVHQSYGGLDTINIVNAIFEMDPSISHDDGGSGKHPNIIV